MSLLRLHLENLTQLYSINPLHVLSNLTFNPMLVILLDYSCKQEEMEGDAKAWRELARDRILRSADAALVILHIITAPNMPKKVHLEESVDQVLALTKFHLDNNVYPQFDPVYKVENKGKKKVQM